MALLNICSNYAHDHDIIFNLSKTTCIHLANYMQCHDLNNFWKEIALRNKSKSTQSNCIAGISGETDIANLWKDHQCSLLNSSTNLF